MALPLDFFVKNVNACLSFLSHVFPFPQPFAPCNNDMRTVPYFATPDKTSSLRLASSLLFARISQGPSEISGSLSGLVHKLIYL